MIYQREWYLENPGTQQDTKYVSLILTFLAVQMELLLHIHFIFINIYCWIGTTLKGTANWLKNETKGGGGALSG